MYVFMWNEHESILYCRSNLSPQLELFLFFLVRRKAIYIFFVFHFIEIITRGRHWFLHAAKFL